MIDRTAFFAAVRAEPFGGVLTAGQVFGMNAMLDAAPADLALDALGYCFSTAYHETARTMAPIEEYGRGRGRSYGVPDPETKQTYFGRGLVQLTWRNNYAKAGAEIGVDLVHKPELALDAAIAAKVMFRGMVEGWFTGKRLADYFGPGRSDPVEARRIINGTDKATIIAGYHASFVRALRAASVAGVAPTTPAPAPLAIPVAPISSPATTAPTFWQRLFSRKAA